MAKVQFLAFNFDLSKRESDTLIDYISKTGIFYKHNVNISMTSWSTEYIQRWKNVTMGLRTRLAFIKQHFIIRAQGLTFEIGISRRNFCCNKHGFSVLCNSHKHAGNGCMAGTNCDAWTVSKYKSEPAYCACYQISCVQLKAGKQITAEKFPDGFFKNFSLE